MRYTCVQLPDSSRMALVSVQPTHPRLTTLLLCDGGCAVSTPTAPAATPGKKWKYADAAKEFHERHGMARFTIMFNDLLDRAIREAQFTSADLCTLLGAIRYAWGHLSNESVSALLQIVTDDLPLTQAFSGFIGLAKGTVSGCRTKPTERFCHMVRQTRQPTTVGGAL